MTFEHERERDFSHIEICVSPDGHARFYPRGDADLLERALRKLVQFFRADPRAIKCAAGTCDTHAHGQERTQ